MTNRRALSDDFVKRFKPEGDLSKIRNIVIEDDTLDMQFRGDAVTIYYRGCAILNIYNTDNTGCLKPCNKRYVTRTDKKLIDPMVDNLEDEYFPEMKSAIDKFISKIKSNSETEIQQQIVRENNYSSISNDTDYFIIDIEYKNDAGKEFDLIAVRWDATSYSRSHPNNNSLIIFELKYGVNAVGVSKKASDKSATLSEHMNDFNNFMMQSEEVKAFKEDMLKVFQQKRELGLIWFKETKRQREDGITTNSHHILSFSTIEFAYILANYNRRSTILSEEISKIASPCSFMYSSFMGYGLYSSNIYNKRQIQELIAISKK